MAKTTHHPPLSLVSAETTTVQPPRSLGAAGSSLWDRIQREYAIADAGGVELLCLACQALDRAEGLRADIEADGAVIRSRSGLVKLNPACREELSARQFVAKTLERLGVTLEPVKGLGRPSQPVGWVPPELR